MLLVMLSYAKHYHPYFPIVPARTFDPAFLADISIQEQHLLTAILTIASKDLVDDPNIYTACSNHMQKLLSALVIGMKCDIEAVEALLILAEWTPHQQNAGNSSVGRGEEDRAAWMYVGMALRVGYFLGLDMTSFRTRYEPRDEEFSRKRLVWAGLFYTSFSFIHLLTRVYKLVICQTARFRSESVVLSGLAVQDL
jgi:hypothetical protein